MKLVLGAVLCLALCVVPINSVNNKLKEVYAWKFVDYAWGKPEDRDAAIASGEFVPENNLPLGLEVWKDKLFITVPRWKNGVVSTLNYVKITDDEETTSPMTTDDPVTPEIETETPEPSDTPTTPTPPDTPTTPTTPDTPTTLTTPDTPTPPTTPDTPTTPTPPDTPTTPTPPDTPTTAEDSTTPEEDSTPSPTASILPMPARNLNFDSSEDEGLLERFERAAGDAEDDEEFEVDTFNINSLLRSGSKSKRKSKKKSKKEEEEDEEEEEENVQRERKNKKRKQKDDEGDEENSRKKDKSKKKKSKKNDDKEGNEVDEANSTKKKKSKKNKSKKDEDEDELDEGERPKKEKSKKNKSKKEKEDEDEDEDEDDDEQNKKKDKSKKSKDKKAKDEKDSDKKKKKKKCKPKPKPTTAAPPPTPETTVTTEATTGTETTAPPPPSPRSPALIPYPSFAANHVPLDAAKRADEPTPIVSVFRVWADTCDRLWVMDTGVSDILGKTAVVSKPRILIYDLNNDELMKTYEFKDSDSEEHSFFANIIVDTDPQNCDKAFAYVPDLGGYGIVSYDFANDKSRRIKHNYFHFDPLAGNMEVGGVNFQWTDGVFSIALSKPMEDNFRTAYFHCLASTKEFSVSTKVLKSEDSSDDSFYDYKLVGDRGPDSQSSASYIHEDTGIMFYTQLQKDSVNCWNTNKPLKPENIVEVASDNETMIFTNDLKVDREGNLWVLTDKLPIFIYKGLDDSEVNYRIFTATVDEAVAGTNCAP